VCDQFGSARVNGGRYIVQNNEWGDTIPQCVAATDGGFTMSGSNRNLPTNGAPAAYSSATARTPAGFPCR
jgi:endoglucanase